MPVVIARCVPQAAPLPDRQRGQDRDRAAQPQRAAQDGGGAAQDQQELPASRDQGVIGEGHFHARAIGWP